MLLRFVNIISSLFRQVKGNPKAVLRDVVIILCILYWLEFETKGNTH